MARIFGRTMPSLFFVFTLHDYTDSDIEFFNVYDFAYVCYGKEICPTTGRKHLQGYFQFKKPTKYLSLPPFKNCPDAEYNDDKTIKTVGRSKWIKPARGSLEQCIDYCSKEGDFYERGTPTKHKGKQGTRNDLLELQQAINNGATYDEIEVEFFSCVAKYSKFIKECIAKRDAQLVLEKHRTIYSDFVLRPWQQNVVDLLQCPVHAREINWVWDQKGNTGKSTLTDWMEISWPNVLVVEPAGKKDLAYIITQSIGLKDTVLFDLSRCQEPDSSKDYNPLNGFYNICEGLKNGKIQSVKYESKRQRVNVCHVWIFANFQPDYTKWSEDRYKVWTIENDTLIEAKSLFKDL